MDVSITDLRANLAQYLAKAKAGESVIITERGKPIATLGPAITEDWLARLEAEGVISPAPDPSGPRPTGPPPDIGRGDWQLSDIVVEMRD